MHNTLKQKLENGQRPIGIFFDTASEYLMECTGRTGIDFVIIDNEHSPIEAETSARLIRVAENAGVTPLCRVREISRPAILKLLDVGAQGLIIPNVHSVQQVEDIISYARYYPIGQRGFCPSRKDGWGFDGLGRLPSIVTSTVGGDALGTSNYWFAAAVFAITLVISLVGLLFYKKICNRHEK